LVDPLLFDLSVGGLCRTIAAAKFHRSTWSVPGDWSQADLYHLASGAILELQHSRYYAKHLNWA